MNLGNILAKKDGTAITGHAVSFKFMTMGTGRVRNINEAEARLFPVDEADRTEAVEAAKAYVFETDDNRDSPTYGQRVRPHADLAAETAYRFLLKMLRDSTNTALPWATTDQLPFVRRGFCEDQVVWLLAQYREYLKGEYPELAGVGATAEDKARVKAQATANFSDAPR